MEAYGAKRVSTCVVRFSYCHLNVSWIATGEKAKRQAIYKESYEKLIKCFIPFFEVRRR